MQIQQLNIPGFTIAYKTWGNPKNPPLLALHGWLDNLATFEWLADYFKHDFYFIAVDLPGHGFSSHLPAGCYYHFIDGIFAVNEIMNALGYEKMHVLGHSMGACLASLFAGVAPERLFSLGLIEGLGPFSHPEESARTQLHDYLNHQKLVNRPHPKGYADLNAAAAARSKRGHVSLRLAKKLCEHGLKPSDDGLLYWRHDPRLLIPSPLRMTEGQILSCLQNITARTCLIWAKGGFHFSPEQIQDRVNAVQSIEVNALEGGHHVHMESPAQVAEILLKFFKSEP